MLAKQRRSAEANENGEGKHYAEVRKDEHRHNRLGKLSDGREKSHKEGRRKGTAITLPFDEAIYGGIYTQG